jgi:RNA polymerase sigma-70 factor (ECF subfamily)
MDGRINMSSDKDKSSSATTTPDLRSEGHQYMRRGWFLYLNDIEPERPRLFRYCRRLSGNVWDAEDLVQETLLRGFANLALEDNRDMHWGAYLARTASNLWIDQTRRKQHSAIEDAPEPTAPPAAETTTAIRDGGRTLMTLLSPQERCAIVLKDVFEYTLAETAGLLETTEGAIKAALHRGRDKLANPTPSKRPAPSEALVQQFVDAFNAADVEAMRATMLSTVTAEVFALGTGRGLDNIDKPDRWIGACLNGHSPDPTRHQRAECAVFEGTPLVILWRRFGDGPEKMEEFWRFHEEEGKIAHIWDYCACPETLQEVGDALGHPVVTRSYATYQGELMED